MQERHALCCLGMRTQGVTGVETGVTKVGMGGEGGGRVSGMGCGGGVVLVVVVVVVVVGVCVGPGGLWEESAPGPEGPERDTPRTPASVALVLADADAGTKWQKVWWVW